MVRFRQTRLTAYVAILVLVAMYIAPIANAAHRGAAAPSKTVIVFPFQTPTECPLDTLGADIASSLTSSLDGPGGYKVFAMSDKMPSIKRALREGAVKKDDVQGPFGLEKEHIQTALKIAREAAADYALVGSVDDLKSDAKAKTGDMTVSACLIDVKTGQSVRTEVVTGKVPAGSKAITESDLVAQAGGDATAKLVADMAMPTTPQGMGTVAHKTASKNNNTAKWIIGALIAVGVGVAVSSHNSSNNSGGNNNGIDNPPAPPGQ